MEFFKKFIFDRDFLWLSGNVLGIEMAIANPLIYPITKNPLTV